MQANFRRQNSCETTSPQHSASVTQVVLDLIDSRQSLCRERGIRLELDVQPIDAMVDVDLVRQALSGLIENAIESTPDGGEITITSIDSPHQWEIEVADSSRYRQDDQETPFAEVDNETNVDLAILIPFPATDKLREAYRAAFQHDGQIQSWRCPQGGLAYALVIPRRRMFKSA